MKSAARLMQTQRLLWCGFSRYLLTHWKRSRRCSFMRHTRLHSLHILPTGLCSAAFAAVMFAAQPAHACDFCEPRVTMTPELAQCYLARVEQEIETMQAASLPEQLLNLATCETAETDLRGASGIPLPDADQPRPTLSFLMDQQGMRCLAQDLAAEDWDPEKLKTFEIRRDCDAQ